LADLPGLIEGAHANKGLGHKFLKHVERTKFLLFLLDGSLDPYDKRSPLNDLNCLFQELSLFNKTYSEKPFLIALNKCDINQDNHNKNLELLKNSDVFQKAKIISISGKEAIGLEELVLGLKEMAEEIKFRSAQVKLN
jgi:GTP-binding protein